MNIGMLVDPYGEKSPGGLGRSIFEMAKAILALDTHNHYTVYVKKMREERPAFSGTHGALAVLGSKHLWLTGAVRMRRDLDAYIFFTPVMPLFFKPKKSIVMAHDFAYLEAPSSTLRQKVAARMLYAIHMRSLRLATRIVANSHYTKERMVQHFGIDPSRIEVIHIGYVAPSSEQKIMAVPEKFFLFAGVLKERKNVAGVIRAFAEAKDIASYHVLIAGKSGGAYHEALVALARSLHVEERVHFLGYVSNEELAYLYAKAAALVFVSFIEGFGMPLLEAMSVGLPVITSQSGALAEVAGAAALLVDPHNPSDIAKAMTAIANDVHLREALKQKAYTRAAEFSWQKFAQRFVEIYHTL